MKALKTEILEFITDSVVGVAILLLYLLCAHAILFRYFREELTLMTLPREHERLLRLLRESRVRNPKFALLRCEEARINHRLIQEFLEPSPWKQFRRMMS